MPIFPLYALLFTDAGMSAGQVSALFAIWSGVGILAEVPLGALADRFSRRWSLVASGVCQALGYALWTALPGFTAFAFGFVLWGLGGALTSGALEALLHDALVDVGAEAHFGVLLGRVTAVELLGQIPAAVLATALFSLGGFGVVGWVSVGVCLASSVVAARLPETPRGEPESYLGTLRSGLSDAASTPGLRMALVVAALLIGVDALEEYFPLLAQEWHVPTALVPVAVLIVPLAGAGGAALGGTRWPVGVLLGVAAGFLAVAGVLRSPVGLVFVAVFYGLYRLVLVTVRTLVQERISGSARATVTSVAELFGETASFGVYLAWVLGGVVAVAAAVAVLALVVGRAGVVARAR
ncbi:MFS transporter [Actinosynnema sp. NPDC020468]|uniref:MFS transporter n=1 Tax=Actinosynnema sp. NPDC020468 TaxID=3154488 RepID=UPI0033CBF89D